MFEEHLQDTIALVQGNPVIGIGLVGISTLIIGSPVAI